VAGCGPAGASAATVAALKGLSVMLVDRRRSVGMPPRCSGYVPKWLRQYTQFDDGAVLQEVSGIRHFDSESRCVELRSPGYVLDRTRLDKTLAIQAIEAGADLANASVLRREGQRLVVRRSGREGVFEGRFLVGADGPGSVVARSIGVVDRAYLATLQYEVGLKTPRAWCDLYAAMVGQGSPAWFVPCGRTARLGVGVPRAQAGSLKTHLHGFMSRLVEEGTIHADAVLEATGGLVPAGCSVGPVQDAAVLLAGAAGGISQPFGGCGIAAAIASGRLAGSMVAEAVQGGCTQALDGYAFEIRGLLGESGIPARQNPEEIESLLERLESWFFRQPDGRAEFCRTS
jgi:digeranylgeranylglycerophospholipid reductase